MGTFNHSENATGDELDVAQLKEAAFENDSATDVEMGCYRSVIKSLAGILNCSDSEIHGSADDEIIVSELMKHGISEDRAWPLMDICAERWLQDEIRQQTDANNRT